MKAAGHEANPLALGRFQAEHHEKAPSRKAGLSDMAEGLALLHGAAAAPSAAAPRTPQPSRSPAPPPSDFVPWQNACSKPIGHRWRNRQPRGG